MVKINESNVVQVLSQYLTENRIPFIYDDPIFEILIGFHTPIIQIEYNNELNLNQVWLTFAFNDYESGGECYTIDDIINPLGEIMELAKNYNKCLHEIETHLNQIEQICNKYDLDFNEFVTKNF